MALRTVPKLSILTNYLIGQFTTIVFGLLNGGTGGVIWVYIGVFVAFSCAILSMAEMASMVWASFSNLIPCLQETGPDEWRAISLDFRVRSSQRSKVPLVSYGVARCSRVASWN